MEGMATLGVVLSAPQARALHKSCDADGDGFVTLPEFSSAIRDAKQRQEESAKYRNSEHFKVDAGRAWDKLTSYLRSQPIEATVKVKRLFTEADADGDGSLDIAELMAGLTSIGVVMNKTELTAFHHDVDADHDGVVTLQEFIDAVKKSNARSAKALNPTTESKEEVPPPPPPSEAQAPPPPAPSTEPDEPTVEAEADTAMKMADAMIDKPAKINEIAQKVHG